MRASKGLVLLALLPLLLFAGCRQPPALGGEPLPKVYQKIVSLSPSTTELIGQMEPMDRLRGRTRSCNWPRGIEAVPVMADVKPDYEKLAQAKPDLIVYDAALYNANDVQKIKDLGFEVFSLDVRTVDQLIEWLYEMGTKSSDPMRYSDYVDGIVAVRGSALANAPSPKPRTIVLLSGGGTEYMAAGLQTFQADLVRAAGGEPIGPDSKQFVTVSVEKMIADDPDVIAVAGKAEDVLRDPRLRGMRSVRAGRVVSINPDVLLRAGARVTEVIRALGDYYQAAFPGGKS
jgi:iron complex transport system substrate-binding protein